jgi:hypothetical protein
LTINWQHHYGPQAVTEHINVRASTPSSLPLKHGYRSVERAIKTMTRRQGVEEVRGSDLRMGVAAWASTRHEVELW